MFVSPAVQEAIKFKQGSRSLTGQPVAGASAAAASFVAAACKIVSWDQVRVARISASSNKMTCLRNLALGFSEWLLALDGNAGKVADTAAFQLDAGPAQFPAVRLRPLRVEVQSSPYLT